MTTGAADMLTIQDRINGGHDEDAALLIHRSVCCTMGGAQSRDVGWACLGSRGHVLHVTGHRVGAPIHHA